MITLILAVVWFPHVYTIGPIHQVCGEGGYRVVNAGNYGSGTIEHTATKFASYDKCQLELTGVDPQLAIQGIHFQQGCTDVMIEKNYYCLNSLHVETVNVSDRNLTVEIGNSSKTSYFALQYMRSK